MKLLRGGGGFPADIGGRPTIRYENDNTGMRMQPQTGGSSSPCFLKKPWTVVSFSRMYERRTSGRVLGSSTNNLLIGANTGVFGLHQDGLGWIDRRRDYNTYPWFYLSLNQWHLAVAGASSSETFVWRDSTLQNIETTSRPVDPGFLAMHDGLRYPSRGFMEMAEIMVFNRTLDEMEVLQIGQYFAQRYGGRTQNARPMQLMGQLWHQAKSRYVSRAMTELNVTLPEPVDASLNGHVPADGAPLSAFPDEVWVRMSVQVNKAPRSFGAPLVAMYIEKDPVNTTAAQVHATAVGETASAYDSTVPPAEACHARIASGTPYSPRGSAGYGPTDPITASTSSLKERRSDAVRALTPGLCGGRRFYTICYNGGAADVHCDESRSVRPGAWKQEWFHVADAFRNKYNVSAVPQTVAAVRGQAAASRAVGSGAVDEPFSGESAIEPPSGLPGYDADAAQALLGGTRGGVPERVVLQFAAFAGDGPAESFVDEIRVVRFEGMGVCPAIEATSLAIDGPLAASYMNSPAALYLLDEMDRSQPVAEATGARRLGGFGAVSGSPSNGSYSASTIGGQPAIVVGAPPLASGGMGSVALAGASQSTAGAQSAVALDPSRGYIEIPALSRFDPRSGFAIEMFVAFAALPTDGSATILSDRAGGANANDFGFMVQLMTNGSLCVRRQSSDGVSVLVSTRPVRVQTAVHIAVIYRGRTGLTYLVVDGEEDLVAYRSGTTGSNAPPGLNIGTPLALDRPLRVGFDGYSTATSGTHGGGGSIPLGSLSNGAKGRTGMVVDVLAIYDRDVLPGVLAANARPYSSTWSDRASSGGSIATIRLPASTASQSASTDPVQEISLSDGVGGVGLWVVNPNTYEVTASGVFDVNSQDPDRALQHLGNMKSFLDDPSKMTPGSLVLGVPGHRSTRAGGSICPGGGCCSRTASHR